jgi:nucleoside-diphosphate-sugar epimerase
MYVEDICKAIKLILDNGKLNEIYNISSGVSLSFREIIETAKDLTKSQSNIIDIPFLDNQKFIQVKNMTLNNNKLSSLGFSCSMNLNKGLQILCK